MMFLHSLPGASESSVNYDLKHISIAGLTMDVDFFIIGEVKGGEALYLLNAAIRDRSVPPQCMRRPLTELRRK